MIRLILLLILLNIPAPAHSVDWCDDTDISFCYPLENEDAANAIDQSSNGIDAPFLNTPTWETSSPAGAWSTYYLDFDGTEGLDLPNTFDMSDPMSWVMWMEADAWGNSNALWYSNNYYHYTYESVDDSILFFMTCTGTNLYYQSGADAVPDPATGWWHMGWTIDSGALLYYIDGVSYTAWTTETPGTSTCPQYTNDVDVFHQAGTREINGRMDDFAAFGDVLTSTDVNDIMNNGLQPVAAGETAANTIMNGVVMEGVQINL